MADVSKDKLLKMYRTMQTIRQFEERLRDLFKEGKVPGFVHVSIGGHDHIYVTLSNEFGVEPLTIGAATVALRTSADGIGAPVALTFGGNPDAVRTGNPGMPCQIMVGYAYYAIERISPYAFLGSVHVLEGISVMLADKLADAMKKSLSLESDAGFTYLRTHGSLDTDHVAFFRTLVDGFDDPAIQRIIIDNAKIFYRLYGAILQDLGARAELSYAA